MSVRDFFDVDTAGEAVWCFVLVALAFVLWPLALVVVIPAMGPWGSLERRRVAEIGAKLALVTAVWCACVVVGVWIARSL